MAAAVQGKIVDGDSRGAVVGVTRHRVVAVLNTALDMLEQDKVKGRRDFYKKLADELFEAPLAGLERIAKLLGVDQAPAAAGAPLNIGNLYVEAMRTVNEQAREPIQHMNTRPVEAVTIEGEANEW